MDVDVVDKNAATGGGAEDPMPRRSPSPGVLSVRGMLIRTVLEAVRLDVSPLELDATTSAQTSPE